MLRGLKKHGASTKIVDGVDDSELRYDKVLAASIALSKVIKKETGKKRIGILLPPGKGGLIANLAVLFAGKIPVNLNFTASDAAVDSCIAQADLDKFITADPFVRKLPQFNWPPNKKLILLDRVLPSLKPKVVLWLALSKILSAGILTSVLGIPKKRGQRGGRSSFYQRQFRKIPRGWSFLTAICWPILISLVVGFP